MGTGERVVIWWVIIHCREYFAILAHSLVNERYYLISLIYSKRASRAEIILEIDNNKAIMSHRSGT